MNEKLKRIGLFIGLTFTLSWLIIATFIVLGGKWGTLHALITAIIIMFMPMTSTILVQKVIYKQPLKRPLGISFKLNKWWLVAWLLPPLIALTTIGVSLLIPGVTLSPEMTGFYERFRGILSPQQIQQIKEQMESLPIHPFWIALIQGLYAAVTINAVIGFGEELGWRGFLLKELSHMNFWKASTIIGIIWGIWHAPLILQGHNYPQHPQIGIIMMTLFCLLLSPIFTYITIKSKSIIAAAILHGSINATTGLPIMITKGGNDLTTGVTGIPGLTILLAINILIYILNPSTKEKTINMLTEEETK